MITFNEMVLSTAPEDYTSTVTNITFPAGSTVQMVSVPTIDDDINEELEEFRAQLSSPSDALMLGSDISAQIDIIDNNCELVNFSIFKEQNITLYH